MFATGPVIARLPARVLDIARSSHIFSNLVAGMLLTRFDSAVTMRTKTTLLRRLSLSAACRSVFVTPACPVAPRLCNSLP